MKSLRLSRRTASGLAALLCVIAFAYRALGDEGLFLPDTLGRLSLQKLRQRGLKLPLSEIYDPARASLKDAVVMVGGGTGAFVSPDGLLLTNYHVGFSALVSASDPTKDYATQGYKANSRADELAAEDYNVTITQDLADVTSEILSGVNDSMIPNERRNTIAQNIKQMELAGSRQADWISVRVLPMNDGLAYYKFTYLTLNDVRIVYAPPRNIGLYGGDPDNFEWPRHCGDFMFMRAYVGPDGRSARYATSNVPYKPKKFLSLSIAGIKAGEFVMAMGYPRTTRRYRESYSLSYNQDVALPFEIDIAGKQLESLQQIGKSDTALGIKLQSTIFNIANSRKNDEGSVQAMRRADIVGRKRAQEAAFTRWLEADSMRRNKYGQVLPDLSKTYQELNTTALRDLLVPQLLQSSSLLNIAISAQEFATAGEKLDADSKQTHATAVARARARAMATWANRHPRLERDLLAYLLRKAAGLPVGQKIEAIERRFAAVPENERRRIEEDFARAIVDSKKFQTAESVGGLYDLSATQLRELNEPFVDFAAELNALLAQQRSRPQFTAIARGRSLLFQGMIEMLSTKPYPDGNRTLRFTYGRVKGYTAYDATVYQAFTNLSGVIAKDTGREPLNVPDKLKQLYRARDFGQYATSGGSDVRVAFLSDTDIIAGNSGSPVLNGLGQQVGIIFDGNYEGLGNDFFYNAERGRSIAVDIRYVLFVTDKLGGAGYLLKELDIQGIHKQVPRRRFKDDRSPPGRLKVERQ